MVDGRGRRSKLTPRTTKTICDAIEKGLTVKLACGSAGINPDTYFQWLRLAADATEDGSADKYTRFSDAVQRAEARGAERLIDIVRESAERGMESVEKTVEMDANGIVTGTKTVTRRSPRDWRAAIALAERRHPEFARKSEVKHDGAIETTGPMVTVNLVFDDGEGEEDDQESTED